MPKTKDKTFCSIQTACEMARKKGIDVSEVTMRHWCEQHGLGHQLGSHRWARWAVNIRKLEEFLDGKT